MSKPSLLSPHIGDPDVSEIVISVQAILVPRVNNRETGIHLGT